jgi:LmbE family N-acetylglucosaminyl deacetylase
MKPEHELAPFHTDPLPSARGPWLVFAPHPDDESFGMGGTLAMAQAEGIATRVVVMTDGALGGSGDDLVQRRQAEVHGAATLLGVHSVQFLNQPDRGLRISEALLQQIIVLITTLKPAAVFFPGLQELHPDHRTTALLVWEALQRMGTPAPQAISYEITGQSPVNCFIDISPKMAIKLKAIGVYQSQLGENNYLDIIKALNRLRTLTLPREVEWAEGFYRYTPAELALGPSLWAQRRVLSMLE